MEKENMDRGLIEITLKSGKMVSCILDGINDTEELEGKAIEAMWSKQDFYVLSSRSGSLVIRPSEVVAVMCSKIF